MHEPGAFTTAATQDAFSKPDSGRRIAAAWVRDTPCSFTTVPPLDLALRPGNLREGRGVRRVLFGAALVLLCAVGLGGCGGKTEVEEEQLEQGEWLVCSSPQA
jgi:hypothetical protein